MLISFRNKGLKELFETGRTARINKTMRARIVPRLDAIDNAAEPEDLKLPGFDFHPLQGHVPVRYSIHVNGPWCITFEFEDGNAYRVDFEQYH
ncbi:MAG: type II toxin-antitoxin system RelE/ParE family toxin [Methylorubrum populi]